MVRRNYHDEKNSTMLYKAVGYWMLAPLAKIDMVNAIFIVCCQFSESTFVSKKIVVLAPYLTLFNSKEENLKSAW